MFTVYLAGPEVFLPSATDVGRQKKDICARYNLRGLFPLDKDVTTAHRSPKDIGAAIYDANIDLIQQADGLIANMTPFRGPSMDVGTAFEVGFAVAQKKPVFGYSNVTGTLVERVLGRPQLFEFDTSVMDIDGLEIENFDYVENLMIEVPIRRTMGTILVGDTLHNARFTDLKTFEQCVRLAADHLVGQTPTISRSRVRG